jgi:Flp pilus assembly protein TadB
MKNQPGVGSITATSTVDRSMRKLRRGPPITLTCECGERRELRYGEQWQCEKCGRIWNTSRIPAEQYDAVRRVKQRLRGVMLGLCALALATVLVFILIGRVIAGILLVAICATTWRMYVWPIQKRRYLKAIEKLPSWEIEPD